MFEEKEKRSLVLVWDMLSLRCLWDIQAEMTSRQMNIWGLKLRREICTGNKVLDLSICMLYLRPQEWLTLHRKSAQSAKRKWARKQPWVTLSFKGWAQEGELVMEPEIKQSERKEENKDKRFLLGIGVKFY